MKYFYFFCLWTSFLLLTACPYESSSPITSAYCALDTFLLGQWYMVDFPKTKDTTDFGIYAFNDKEYLIESKQRSDTVNFVAHYRGYISKIAGFRVLNLHNFRGENTFMFLRYTQQQDQVKFYFLNDAYFGETPLDTFSIQTVINRHQNAEDLFELESSIILHPLSS